MSITSNPPKSPTLAPPRKSVELEDPGAHELLETSENEDDVFADASEGQASNSVPNSPIPTTRVEKVDDRESHGEVPGTAAYKLRTQDAVPDELEIIPDSGDSRPSSSTSHQEPSSSLQGTSIPKTVVEKVDAASPSHGDIPGTVAHSKRRADAVPDVVLQTPDSDGTSDNADRGSDHLAESQIPKTVITKVASESSHGEVAGTAAFDVRKADTEPDVVERKGYAFDLPTSLNRSRLAQPRRRKSTIESASPIAADGGFGPMDDEESEDNSDQSANDTEAIAKFDINKGFGEDFDDFEDGGDEEFGDFDEGLQHSSGPGEEAEQPKLSVLPVQSLPPPTSPFSLLDFSELDTLDEIIAATSPFFNEMFPSTTKEEYPPPPPLPSNQNSMFLTDRSLSLWSQLVAPPPLQPPNWVRSRIRRLFLVSLGVPVDLDEILPASKQKKLILPSIHLRSRSQSPPYGRRQDSRVRLKQDNASTASVDRPASTKARRRKGPPAPPELDFQATKLLYATTVTALSNMTDGELHAHIKELEEANAKASEVLEYWLKRRDSALGDKEAFEGVIENLVKHARKSRK